MQFLVLSRYYGNVKDGVVMVGSGGKDEKRLNCSKDVRRRNLIIEMQKAWQWKSVLFYDVCVLLLRGRWF
jgi:hypothetical protein